MRSLDNHRDQMHFLLRTLELARSRRGYCAPNPAVGALIVREGVIVGEGVHWACGQPHAEVMALRFLVEGDLKESRPLRGEIKEDRPAEALKEPRGNTQKLGFQTERTVDNSSDLTLYVSLEPCSHQGRTPPCTEAIIAAGVRRVVYAYQDPNPIVAGKGHERLVAAGVEVITLQVPEIEEFYLAYRHWHQFKKPWVRAKLAMSLDGKIAGPQGERIQITGQAMKEHTYRCRQASDAILTTAKTIQQDDPFLDVRLGNTIENKRLYILDRELTLSKEAKIWHNTQPIAVFYSSQNTGKLSSMPAAKNIRYIPVSEKQGQLDLEEVLLAIGADGIHDLWVEAGGLLLRSLLAGEQVQELQLACALKCLGASAQSAFQDKPMNFNDFLSKHCAQIGEDLLCIMRKQPPLSSVDLNQSNQEVKNV